MVQSFDDSRHEWIEDEWRDMVADMQSDVRTDVEKHQHHLPDLARPGRLWAEKISCVTDMIEYLFLAIRRDLGLSTDETFASMLLVERALYRCERELGSYGDREEPNGDEANEYRVFHALEVLTPDLDDIQMRRFRALQAAEWSARKMHIPRVRLVNEPDLQVGESLSSLNDEERFAAFGEPVGWALFARRFLASIDERFQRLDPLLVLEELGEADAESVGGRTNSGEGRFGPLRALARLAVTYGALDFKQRQDETFDQAVDRARQVLMTTRSRIRRQLRSFRTKWRLGTPRPRIRARSKRSKRISQ
jgi:hypothetical protein